MSATRLAKTANGKPVEELDVLVVGAGFAGLYQLDNMRRLGYKAALLIGLGLYAAGAFLFYPAAADHSYGLFLFGLFIIASGLAFLETSANHTVRPNQLIP